jgi:hypothetical protein
VLSPKNVPPSERFFDNHYKTAESIHRGNTDRSEADVEIADKKQRVGGKR